MWETDPLNMANINNVSTKVEGVAVNQGSLLYTWLKAIFGLVALYGRKENSKKH